MESTVRLLHPMLFWACVVGTAFLPFLLWEVSRRLHSRVRDIAADSPVVMAMLLPSRRRMHIAAIFLVVASMSMTASAGGVLWYKKSWQPNRESVGIALLIDVSRSSESQNGQSVDDLQYMFDPTYGRLGSIKIYLRALLESMEQGYTIFPIPFAGGDAFPMPPVKYYDDLFPFLRPENYVISPYRFDNRGTDIAVALDTATNILGRWEGIEHRVVVLLSDGDLEDVGTRTLPNDVRSAIDRARRKGLIVFTVLVGTPGVRVRVLDRESPDGFYHPGDGSKRIVYTEPNPWMMQEIARRAGDAKRYFLADNPAALERALRDVLGAVETLSLEKVDVLKNATTPALFVALLSVVGVWVALRPFRKFHE